MSASVGPQLETLDQPPTWCNQAGRVDRSACVELRATLLRRHIPEEEWRNTRSASRPGSKRPSARVWREWSTDFTVSPGFLERILVQQPPRKLSGDWRTARSLPMRAAPNQKARYHPVKPAMSSPVRLPPAMSSPVLFPDRHLPINPNRGAGRTKVLALPDAWTQTVRLERWRLHALLIDAFLICPVCGEKFKKLYLPLCSPAEARDAKVADLWLRSHGRRGPGGYGGPAIKSPALQLLARYGTLFAPRRFVCKACLGMRYGEGMRKRDRGTM